MRDDLSSGTYAGWKSGNVLRCQRNMVVCRRESRAPYTSFKTRSMFRESALFWMRCALDYKQRRDLDAERHPMG